MSHTCHAIGCTVEVKPELLMCFKHWQRVPKVVQKSVWDHYRPGQCDDKNPSEEWHVAADAAIGIVALKEGLPCRESQIAAIVALGLNPQSYLSKTAGT